MWRGVAAVAALATRARSVRETVRVGLAWGAGHAVTLFAALVSILIRETRGRDAVAVEGVPA